MTTINATSPVNHAHRTQFSAGASEAKETHEASGLHADPRIRQLQPFIDNLARAVDRRASAVTRYLSQLNTSLQFSAATAAQLGLAAPPSAVGPQVTEVVAHPEILEELKKHREREARLSADAREAIEGTERPMADMLRIFGFLDFLDNPHTPDSPDSREDKTEVGDEPMINPHDKDASGLIWNSHSEFYEMIGQLIAALQQNWLSKYQDAMKVFLEFYEEFSDAMDKVEVGKPSNGKEDIQLNFDDMRTALETLFRNFSSRPMASFSTEAEAQAFIDSLNLPGLKPVSIGGEFQVMINLDSVQEILKSIDGLKGQIHWSPAKYNAWLSSKDGSVEDIKHVSKVLGEKLNEVTQKFDNIVKILSSTIDKITEADMSFVRGL